MTHLLTLLLLSLGMSSPWAQPANIALLAEEMQRVQSQSLERFRDATGPESLQQRCEALQRKLDGARFGDRQQGQVWVFTSVLPMALEAEHHLLLADGPAECAWQAVAVSFPKTAAQQAITSESNAPTLGPALGTQAHARFDGWSLALITALLTALGAAVAVLRTLKRRGDAIVEPMPLPFFESPDITALQRARNEQADLLKDLREKSQSLAQEVERVRGRLRQNHYA